MARRSFIDFVLIPSISYIGFVERIPIYPARKKSEVMSIPKSKWSGQPPKIHREKRKAVVLGDGLKPKQRPPIKRRPPAPKWSR